MFDDVTQSATVKFDRILVVHDSAFDVSSCFSALQTRFIVRSATLADAATLAQTVETACVIGVVAGNIRARALAASLASIVPDRLLLLRTPAVQPDDDVFMLTTPIPWLPFTAPAAELVARVQKLVLR